MIQITRLLARQLKPVFRRMITENGRGTIHAPVLMHAGPEGLRIRISSSEVAAEYHDPTPCEADAAYVPFEFLNDCEANSDTPVQIEMTSGDRVMATWNEGHVPQMKHYDVAATEHFFPTRIEAFADNPPELANALHAAMETASNESTRYSLHCVQLSGSGTIAATDAGQILVQSGFEFPWEKDLLIPRRSVFGSSQLPSNTKVEVGKSERWVCFRIGSWSFQFAINVEGRFPDVESMIRDAAHASASIQIDSHDATFLLKSMKQLPGGDTFHSPVTVDANGRVFIRSQGEDAPSPVEILLSNSTRSGQAERINTDRKFLRRALDLGFREIHVFAPDQPLLCVDHRRKYLWATLTPEDAIKPSDDAVRISSVFDDASVPITTTQTQQETTVAKSAQTSSANSQSDNQQTASRSTDELIDAAEHLKASLRDTLGKTNELIVGLKRHRKEAKIVRTTLDSLRQLQTVG
ncbi:MAG: hypothetical protein H6822_06630 [Planctomycetaceae bacterium]|nr:hypothetical protein [Planctomycetaceae bacterium]